MRGISKAFWDKKASLPLVAIALGETQQQVSSGQVGEDKCKALRPVRKECEAKLAKLETIFQKTLPENGISKVRRGWMALSSLRQDKKVEEIAQALRKFLQVLTAATVMILLHYYHVVSAPTAQDIAVLTEGASNVALWTPAATVMIYYMAPVKPATDFTSREGIMTDLDAKLCLPNKHSRVALVGLGGGIS